MKFQEAGVEHAYTIELAGGDATFQRVKWAMRDLSNRISSKKNRLLFRSVLLHSLTTHVRFKGSVNMGVEELFEWQEQLEANHETIMVTVDTDERQTKKQKKATR